MAGETACADLGYGARYGRDPKRYKAACCGVVAERCAIGEALALGQPAQIDSGACCYVCAPAIFISDSRVSCTSNAV